MARPRNIEREEGEKKGTAGEPLYATWAANDPRGRARAMLAAGGSEVVLHAAGSAYDLGGGVWVRHAHDGRRTFGGSHGKPRKPRDIIWACMQAYEEFGIVRNIIDTMADFSVQGVCLTHPNPRIEKFYQEWFYKVGGAEVSEHIANTLFLCANAPVRRHTAKLRQADVDNLQRGLSSIAPEGGLASQPPAPPTAVAAERPDPPVPVARREVPWRYTVMNPVLTVVQGGDLVPFLGPDAFSYAVEVPAGLLTQIKRPKNELERALVSRLPDAVRKGILDGMNVIPLDSTQMRMLHYKRRHWQVWATPMTYPLLDDLAMLRKLKMADLSALDGAISHIRVWRLGSLENRMMPTPKAIQKLADMLANAGNGVSMDLIWGPDLSLQETSTEIHRFLGDGKYAPVLAAIFAGYGIPPTLIGAAVTGGMTNNFISLKTLTERLQYVRRIVREFWEYEIVLVQRAMNFRLPASVRFDRMVLTDEAAEKALLIQMADRDLISAQTVQERFGEDPLLELVRQRREARQRRAEKMPQKAGAFHNPQGAHDLLKLFVGQGHVTPGQAGVDLDEKKPGEKTLLDHQAGQQERAAKLDLAARKQEQDHAFRTEKLRLRHGVHPAQQAGDTPGTPPPTGGSTPPPIERPGQPGQGRPRLSRDSRKRKKKRVRVRTKASLRAAYGWAKGAMRAVREAALPAYLASLGSPGGPQEEKDFSDFAFALLVNLPCGREVTAAGLKEALSRPLPVPAHVKGLLGAALEKAGDPTPEQVRDLMCKVAALHGAELDLES